jgi:hypothetical protein
VSLLPACYYDGVVRCGSLLLYCCLSCVNCFPTHTHTHTHTQKQTNSHKHAINSKQANKHKPTYKPSNTHKKTSKIHPTSIRTSYPRDGVPPTSPALTCNPLGFLFSVCLFPSRYKTPKARRFYCSLTGLNEAWVRAASTAQLRRALANLRKNFAELSVPAMRNELLRFLLLPADVAANATPPSATAVQTPHHTPSASSTTARATAPVVVTVPDIRPQGGRENKRVRPNQVITID